MTAADSEAVSFVNGRGQRLVGALHGGIGATMAVSCHGMFSSKQGRKHVALAAALQELGVPLLRFDFAGHGESDGRLFDVSYSRRMEDLDAALGYLAGRGARHFALFGSSMGGAVALLTAARDERVVGIATLAAVGNPAELVRARPEAVYSWKTQGYYDAPEGRIGRDFLDDSLAHDVVGAVGVLRAPVLIIHGDRDTVVPCSDAHDLAAAARHASLELVEGADHAFSDPTHLRPALRQAARFMAGRLKAVV